VTQPDHVQASHPQRKLGRLPKHTDEAAHPRLKLAQFLTAGYTGTVPSTVDYASNVKSWPMARNSDLGDCTAADACHGIQVWTTYGQGNTVTCTDADVVAFYSGSTGYNPADPSTDQGGNMQDVCNYFLKTGMAGHKIAAFFQVDPAQSDQLRAALWLFGGVSVGFPFPHSAMAQFDAGKPWTPVAGDPIDGGHDVLLVGMTAGGNYRVVTWGRVQEVTPAFWAKYMADPQNGEAWARVSLEWLRNNGTPEGLSAVAVNAAFQQITGRPGPFPVTPGPTPAPAPAPAPSPAPAPQPAAADKALATAVRTWLAAKHL
jgi:hypothetical protein